MPGSRADRAARSDQKEKTRAIDYAIALVASRSRPEKNLRDKLLARYEEDEVEATVARMRELGLVDDAAWAERFARDRFERLGKGRHRIRNELLARGIDAATAETALASVLSDESERARAAAALDLMKARLGRSAETSADESRAAGQAPEKTVAEAEKARNRLFRRMLARGYPASLVRDLLDVS